MTGASKLKLRYDVPKTPFRFTIVLIWCPYESGKHLIVVADSHEEVGQTITPATALCRLADGLKSADPKLVP
jgi:hypothetical protein